MNFLGEAAAGTCFKKGTHLHIFKIRVWHYTACEIVRIFTGDSRNRRGNGCGDWLNIYCSMV